MVNEQKSELKEPDKEQNNYNEPRNQSEYADDLKSDPDFEKLIEHYQKGEFDLCNIVLNKLEKRYPGHPELQKIQDELEMKSSVRNLNKKIKRGDRRQRRRATFNLGIFAIIGTIIVMIAFLFSLYYFGSNQQQEEVVDQGVNPVVSLNAQAQQLLNIGRPGPAEEIIARIEEIDPNYENLPQLKSQLTTLIDLEERYQEGLDLVQAGQNEEALVVFKEIEVENPGMWDVSQRIASIENDLQIADYFAAGDAAYQAEDWLQVIDNYENALALGAEMVDPLRREQLLKGYLYQMIAMLQSEDATQEDITKAEGYYRKAVALIPQSREFASERGNLQEVSTDLLEEKYTQTAKAILVNKNQSLGDIAKAVSYLRRAANINPDNTILQADLKNAEYYQIGFQNVVEMNWVKAVDNLSRIVSNDRGFANGNASTLLYEAYYALAQQYYAASLYQDAVKNLEQAELLAWDDQDNLLKLFQVQVFMGDALGRMSEFEDAVSYYDYAFNTIDIFTRLIDYPEKAEKYNQAVFYSDFGDDQSSYQAFQELLAGIDVIYSVLDVEIDSGVCLALFASEHNSTVKALLDANDLQKTMVITFGRTLKVPTIQE